MWRMDPHGDPPLVRIHGRFDGFVGPVPNVDPTLDLGILSTWRMEPSRTI